MTSHTTKARKKLHLGIEAARSGRKEVARAYLTEVLELDSDHIPALFWMAYVAPSSQESIVLLQRVLVLDPANDRAEAGLRWAQQRLEPGMAEAGSGQDGQKGRPPPAPAQAAEQPLELPDEFIREQLLSQKDYQLRAKKGALAHRARRTIDPLLTIIIILAVAAMLTAGIWLLAFAPADTLAAWLPAPVESMLVDSGALTLVSEPEAVAPSSRGETITPHQNFSSRSDTIVVERSKPGEAVVSALGLSRRLVVPAPQFGSAELISLPEDSTESVWPKIGAPDSGEAPADTLSSSVAATLTDSSPESFIGPADTLLTGPRLFEPVAEALLVHRPTSPTEKWIEVDVTEQRVTAWEGNLPVMSFLTSTGLPNTPTLLGEFNIYWKLESTLMTGPGYYLPEVPYTMYFYAGYALHGAYWHDNFGSPMSHGCVNLSIDHAKELFEWADPVIPPGQTQVLVSHHNPGTLVVVHE
ncbi:MAG: L,D-transpeptidase [Anaerolineae bacterium]|nr:L,D-transpeptidase [Anaerolineae bacterium]